MIKIGKKIIGKSKPIFIIAEIGINHNGQIKLVEKLIDAAVDAGADAVKFQKRTPELCVPKNQRNIIRETPWGNMTYLEYKKKIELSENDFLHINKYCKQKKIQWFASCWDADSLKFIKRFNPVAYKIASASLTEISLLNEYSNLNKPIILSTGMSTINEINKAIKILKNNKLLISHCTSSYPCKTQELNLNVIPNFIKKYNFPIGYSGHEIGIQTSIAAVVLGACFIERHITLDRSMWGTDQSASLEPRGLKTLVRDIRIIEQSLGDGIKKVYPSEKKIKKKLRI